MNEIPTAFEWFRAVGLCAAGSLVWLVTFAAARWLARRGRDYVTVQDVTPGDGEMM